MRIKQDGWTIYRVDSKHGNVEEVQGCARMYPDYSNGWGVVYPTRKSAREAARKCSRAPKLHNFGYTARVARVTVLTEVRLPGEVTYG